MKANNILVVIFLFIFSARSVAQNSFFENRFNINVSPSLGITYANYKNLNNEFVNSGYDNFSPFHNGIGLDFGLEFKNISAFIHVFSSAGQNRINRFALNNLTDILSAELGLEYKFKIKDDLPLAISLFGSYGRMSANLQIETPANTNNFSSFLNGSGNVIKMDNYSDIISSGLGIYWFSNDNLRYNFKIGYRINRNSFWIPYTNNDPLINSPKDNLSGIFLNLGIDVNVNVFRKGS